MKKSKKFLMEIDGYDEEELRKQLALFGIELALVEGEDIYQLRQKPDAN